MIVMRHAPDSDDLVLIVSSDEATIIEHCMNEARNGLRSSDFRTRTGRSSDEARTVLRELADGRSVLDRRQVWEPPAGGQPSDSA